MFCWVSFKQENENDASDGVEEGSECWNRKSTQGIRFLYFLFQACNSCTILLLLVSAGLLFAIEIIQQGANTGWHDGTAVLVAIFAIVVSSSVGSFARERVKAKKTKEGRDMLSVEVERNGESFKVSVSGVKEGDKVHLNKGDQVPGDGFFISNENLKLDEVINSEIDRDKNPFLFAGSRVLEGEGFMVVTSVGPETALGQIPISLSYDGHEEKTLLQALLDKPYDYMEKLALFMSVLIAFVALIRLLCKKHDSYNELPELKGPVTMKLLMQMFERFFLEPRGKFSVLVSSLVALVIGFQHGMPLVIVICLYRWKKKLVSSTVDPHNLAVCGTIGLISVIFIDATGDLCEQMEVKEFWVGENDIRAEPELVLNHDKLYQGINVWVNLPEISVSSSGDLPISWAKSQLGVNEEFFDKEFEVLKYRRSISSKKSCGVLMRKTSDQEEILQLHWKGPASTILDMCTHFYDSNGEMHKMESYQKEKFGEIVKEMEKKGLRPIAFAFGQTEVVELGKEGLNLLAIVGVSYPCKEEIKSFVKTLGDDKVTVKLVSEDDPSVVRAIAWSLGLTPRSNYDEIEGQGMVALDIEEMEKHMQTIVMGDSHPKDKLDMVERTKKDGHVVAFCGGFTRDIQALKMADVGITQEKRCTEMARLFSDISIGNLCLTSEIRTKSKCVYRNIQRFFQLQLTTWIAGLTITLISTILSGDSPLTSLDMIWVNLIICILGGLMMVMEFKDQEPLANHEPFDRNQSLITKFMWINIAIHVCYQVSILLICQLLGNIAVHMDKDVLQTMIFNTFVFCQLVNLFNAMSFWQTEVLEVVLNNYCFLVALTTVLSAQVMLVQLGHVQLWVTCLFLAASSLMFELVVKKLLSFTYSRCSLASTSASSYFGFLRWRPQSIISYVAFPFSVLLLFSTS